jgi:hypothetical protein
LFSQAFSPTQEFCPTAANPVAGSSPSTRVIATMLVMVCAFLIPGPPSGV